MIHLNHSVNAQEKVCRIDLNLPNHKLTQDITKQWNLTYYMLERLLEQQSAVFLYLTDQSNVSLLIGNF